MWLIHRFKLAQYVAGLAAAGIVTAVSAAGAAYAYGPPLTPTAQPGSYYCVVTSLTVGRAGQTIGPVRLSGLAAWLSIRPGTFSGPVQITITEPYNPSQDCPEQLLGDAGFPGARALGGLGILVDRGGSAYQGAFAKPLALRLTSRSITRSSPVVVWDGKRFATVRHSVVRGGQARVLVAGNSEFAVLNRLSARHLRNRSMAARRGYPASVGLPGLDHVVAAAVFAPPRGARLAGAGAATTD
jgi:hypothetical protein